MKFCTCIAAAAALFISQVTSAGELDYANYLSADKLPLDAPIHVHLFDTEDTDLGNPKFRDAAASMVKSAPHLLAADIVTALREAGFTAVTLDESPGGAAPNSFNLTGAFTKLDPGSQNLRVWIGFGAGESKVCISGKLSDDAGKKVAEFADCKNGLGWGESAPQGDKGAHILGHRVADFIVRNGGD